jgi:hypothetical protein
MKRFIVALSAAVLFSSSALGGTIDFTPSVVWINPYDPPVYTLELSIGASSLDEFDSADIIVGSDDLAITGFEFGDYTRFFESTGPDTSVYQSGWKFGYFGPLTPPGGFHLGTLTVDISGAPIGEYYIVVDADRDGGRSTLAGGGVTDPLSGVAVFMIPEPATLSLLTIGCLTVLFRSGKPSERRTL